VTATTTVPMRRDVETAKARNICGALLVESGLVFGALHDGRSATEVRDAALSGSLFRQRSWQARRRFWHALNARYLGSSPPWVISDLVETVGTAPTSGEAIGLLYIHFVLRDRLTLDIVTGPLWDAWTSGRLAVTAHEMGSWIEAVARDFFGGLTEGSRKKLATSILSGLRDYGLLRGAQAKTICKPVVASCVVSHLLRILIEEGQRGRSVLEDPAWRMFLLTPDEVAGHLASLAQERVVRFERAGSTVVLETPWGMQ
jgi:hypothetical protein